jgi:hypothetical protein
MAETPAVHERVVTGTQAVASTAPKASGGKPSTAGHAASGAAKGAASGAALGSVVPVVGTGVGAVGGAVVGGATGGLSGRKKKAEWKLAKRSGLGAGRQIVVMEFVICMVILAFSPLTDKHKTEGPAAFMRRGSAVCALFLVLALLSAGGPRAGRVAAGFGGLVTLTLLVSSRDVFVVLAKKFNSSKDGPAGPGEDLGEDVGGVVSGAGVGVGTAAGDAASEVAAVLNRLNPSAAAGPLGNGIR